MPTAVPKIDVLEVLTPRHYLSFIETPKGTSLVENRCYESSCIVIGPAVWPEHGVKNTHKKTKGRTKSGDKLGVRLAHPPIPILTTFGMLGGHWPLGRVKIS